MIVPEYPPHTIGGGGVVFKALVDQLEKQHDVRVFSACDPSRSWTQRLASDSTPSIRRYPLLPTGRGKAHLRSVIPPNPLAAVQLARDLASWKPDVGHLHGYGYALVDVAALVLRRLKIPYVFTNHGFPVTQESRAFATRSLYRGYEVAGAGRTAARSAITTYISPAVLSKESHLRPDHSVIIENGLVPLPTASQTDRQRLRKRLGVGDALIIGAAGRLAWSKGFDLLIESLSHLRHLPVTCVIAGNDGGQYDALVRLASTVPSGIRVLLPGQLDRKDLGTLFALAAVVAVPSRDEPFGLVALEAMALGTRVVAAATGGLEGFVEKPLGSLVCPSDPKSLAAGLDMALITLIDPQEQAQRAALLEQRSWHTVAKVYEEALTEASQTTTRRGIGLGR